MVAAVQQALTALGDDPQGRLALERLRLKGFKAAVNSDWDDVRSLEIDSGLGKTR